MRNLDAIVIPTGTHKQDLERVRKALEVGGNAARYVVSGIGPDTDKALVDDDGRIQRYNPSKQLDFHHELWDYLMRRYDNGTWKKGVNVLGLDTLSLTSRENLMYAFPEGTSGTYGLVSYPLHLWRFKLWERKLKKKGLMSKEVQIEHIPTKPFLRQSPREFLYGTIALAKDLLKS